ncbi:AAA family ATPase [Micromonospora krabiensis]|uniref:AAA ATPase domain-containing protein n=1 Tax=Micromonospora krabiensis TaxID=307121 RepID=A0A1C3NE86_9ACTN|nr:ATP-binding protein [Micromonospora krabiensis]SBV30895.1 AAA ATPase domain-containing protein [Micromonospora krabiensis]
MIGRRREIAALDRLLDRAAAGVGGALVIVGPPGSGKSALADAAGGSAHRRGLPVTRTITDTGTGARLVVLDDLDPAATAADLDRLVASGAAVVATTVAPGGPGPYLHLAPLTEADLAAVLPGLPAGAVHAVWLLTAGWPGPALDLAASLPGGAGEDAVVEVALAAPSRGEFLVLDMALIRLLEEAASRALPPEVRARVLVRLARELLGDPSAATRRRELVDEAVRLARDTGEPGTTAEVLDGRLHALWDPAAADERLSTASQIVDLARRAGNALLERRGLFWRFIALAEGGDLDAAEAALVAYARAGERDGDPEAGVVALSRHAVLALVRGRLEAAEALIAEVSQAGRRIGLADTDRLTATLAGRLATLRGDAASQVEPLRELSRKLPGHFFEVTAARALAESGRVAEALLDVERLLPALLRGAGPRWVGAVADLALVASYGAAPAASQALYDALAPHAGRLVVWGGANTITGPVDDYLGRLAAHLGRRDEAAAHFDRAIAQEERLGALPWLASTLAARGRPGDVGRARTIADGLGLPAPRGLAAAPPASGPPAVAHRDTAAGNTWRLRRDGNDWVLEAGAEQARLRDMRGLHHLRILLANPGREISALDLVAGGAGLVAAPPEPVLDATARLAYRRRLDDLAQQLDSADRSGDVQRAATLTAERSALLAELRRAAGLGGRPRRQSAEAERARVNATRALRTLLERVEPYAPIAAAHLRASLHTGTHFRYQPAAGGPTSWQV